MCVLCGRPEEIHAITTAELAASAAAAGGKPVLSDADFIERLQDADGGAWAPYQTIGFSFPTTKPSGSNGSDYTGFNPFTDAQKESVRLAFSLWSDVANLRFSENATSSARQGQITFSNSDTIGEGVWGFAFTSGSNRPVWVNFDSATDIWGGRTPGNYDFSALLHEIGHALGLLHPGDYNASDDGNTEVTYANNADFMQDSRQYTIMSYFSASETGASHARKYAATPLIYDVLAVQDFYGRNYATRSGDTVYGFNSTAGRSVLDFTVNTQPVVTIWDGGGRNTLDLSGFTATSNVDLRPGSFSDAAGLTRNLSIAFATYIADVTTGSGTDTVRDNGLANRIVTGAGDDLIILAGGGNDSVDGGAGTDTLRLLGGSDVYRTTTNADGTLTLKGPTGSLLVGNVESFVFTAGAGQTLTRDQVAALDFNGLLYVASNPDLINAFGADPVAGKAHWLTFGQHEGRSLDSFNPLDYLASNKDLIAAFGLDFGAATRHYITYGYKEGRPLGGFDALSYIASDTARIDTIGVSAVGGMLDYVQNGYTKGASITFSGLAYIASYADLRAAFGMNPSAGLSHYLNYGVKEYREVRFDAAQYLASNPDLIRAFGYNLDAAYSHYFNYGAAEGRSYQRFNAYDYAGSNPDLVNVLGYDVAALTRHYLTNGFAEGRSTGSFDVTAYAMANSITGDDWQMQATKQYLAGNRTAGTPFGTDQTNHRLVVGTATTDAFTDTSDGDWFLFRGEAYTNYKVVLEFLNQSGNSTTTLAELSLRGQDNVVVDYEYGRYPSVTMEFFTQEAEDVYLELAAYSSSARNYRITVSVVTDKIAAAAAAAPAEPVASIVGQADVPSDEYWLM
ncbi:M10 family metallopeptidase C-terminal domain-containing protein [Niveispirillum sp. KHB5.9]|uniref:M10 family metallopeptidase C-terminal domain-containing protein n=1 Tax=Niveispirillum sp. KHB5.9 TaxID=3400269 RepID=UPI003A88D71A